MMHFDELDGDEDLDLFIKEIEKLKKRILIGAAIFLPALIAICVCIKYFG